MNKTRFISSLPLLVATALMAAPRLQADSGTWSVDANGDWGSSSNWAGGIVADGAGSTATFDSFTASRVVTVDTVPEQVIGGIAITNTAGAFTLGSSGGAVLKMDNNGSEAFINVNSKIASTISAPIALTAGGLKVATTAGSAALTLSGAISSLADSGVQTLTLTNGGSGILLVSGAVSDGIDGGRIGVLVDTGSGPVSITGNNSFTGGVTIRRGALRITGQGAAGNTIYLGDAASGGNSVTFSATGGTYSGDIVVSALGTGAADIQPTSAVGTTDSLFTGSLQLERNASITVNAGVTMTFSGAISGVGKLTLGMNGVNANNTITLSGNNTFTGGLAITSGSYRVNINSATALGTGNVTLGTGSTTQPALVQIDNTSGAAITNANNNAQVWSNFTFIGTNSFDLGTGDVTISTPLAIATVLGNKLTVGGVISGANKSVGNAGSGTLELTALNTYTGATTVGGVLAVTALANGDVASNIGQSSNAAANLVLNRGTLQYTGEAVSTDRLFTVGNGGGTIESSGSGALEFTNTGANESTDALSMTLGAGTQAFGPGATVVRVNTIGNTSNSTANLAVGMTVTGANIAPGTVITEILDGGRIAISAATTGTSVGGSFSFGAIDRTLTLTGSNAGDNRIAGVLADSATKTLGLTKTGSGKWILSGANTYTGSTLISEGKLVVDGSIASSSGVTVASGASLGGHGVVSTISGAGLVGPGNSPGILTASSVDPSGGLGFSFEFTNEALGGVSLPDFGNAAASGNDVLRLTSETPFAFSLTAANVVTVDFTGLTLTMGDSFLGGFYTDSGDFWSDISNANFQYLGLGDAVMSVSMVQLSADFGAGMVDGYITQFTVVPEPSTWAILLAGAGSLLFFRRRGRVAA